MSRVMKSLMFFIAATASFGATIPPNFKRCLRKDPNFKKCYHEAAQHGIQQLTRPYKVFDLPKVDPLDVPELVVRGGGGVVAVDQYFRDCKLEGLIDMKFDKFELDFDNKTLDAVGTTPELIFKCQYQLDGKVLFLPIQGKGASVVKMQNFHVELHADYEEFKRGKKTYYKTKQNRMLADVTHVHFQFDDLFNGNKQLSDNINRVLNDNWFEIYEEIRPQYTEIVRLILSGMMERIWNNVSLEEFFD